MKKNIILVLMLVLTTSLFSQEKGFEKGNSYHSIGFGGQNYFRVANDNYNYFGFSYGAGFTTQYRAEFGIHDYVGLGFHAGLTFKPYAGSRFYNNSKFFEMYVPLGVQANFHFYQLIDDKTSSNIHSDKLDIYAGVNFGGGPAFLFDGYNDETNVFGGIHAGPQVGVRYYPSKNFGIFAELGYGSSFAQFGVVLR